MQEETPHNRLSLGKAAKAIGKSRSYVRALIESGKLTAYKVGGSEDRPWLEVYQDELRTVHDAECIYVPKALRKKRQARRVYKSYELDPLADRL